MPRRVIIIILTLVLSLTAAANAAVTDAREFVPVQDGFTIAFTTNDGTAKAGSDYTDNDGTLTFAGNVSEEETITVRILDVDLDRRRISLSRRQASDYDED